MKRLTQVCHDGPGADEGSGSLHEEPTRHQAAAQVLGLLVEHVERKPKISNEQY